MFNTSLVREKIIFLESSGKEPTVVRSNRIFLKLGNLPAAEKVVVRAQNMHTTLRLAAKIFYAYHHGGPILGRPVPFDWDAQWEASLSGYEKEFNLKNWASVYINGKSVFKTVASPFVDVIEKCALLTIDNYDATMEVTQNALMQIGHAVRIDHSSNVASIFADTGEQMRCGIIHRAGSHDTIFNFSVSGGETHNRIVQTIGIAASYLDVFHLRFTVQQLQAKLRNGEIKKVSPESAQIRAAIARQIAISKSITSFEDLYQVHYRPTKPDIFSWTSQDGLDG